MRELMEKFDLYRPNELFKLETIYLSCRKNELVDFFEEYI